MVNKKLTTLQKDALFEVMSIGMGHSSMALSSLVKDKIEVKLDSMDLLPLSQIPTHLGSESVLSTAVYLRIIGELSGTTLLVFPRDTALLVTDILHGRQAGTTKIICKEDRSGIEEMGNILTASFLNAMSDFLKIKIVPSTPVTVFDVSNSIVRFVLIGVNKKVDQCLITKVNFISSLGAVKGNFMLLLDCESLDKMVSLVDARIQKNKD
jgi:chemotaxis protein CheC